MSLTFQSSGHFSAKFCKFCHYLSFCIFAIFFQLHNQVNALESLSTVGGAFMYGHIYWNSSAGNVVTFHVEAGYRRSILTSYWQNGNAQVGDVLLISDIGIGPTIFDFGDGSFANTLNLKVTAYSVIEDWILGELELVHQYAAPSDSGRDWVASLSGCCRMESLAVQKDADFVVSTHVNLLQSLNSPVARSLPLPVSYMQTGQTGVELSNVFVTADDPAGNRSIEWSILQPWDVGSAANFSATHGSFASISLNALYSTVAPAVQSCPAVSAGQTSGLGISPGCLFALLRTEAQLLDNALTVEGWFYASAPGYLLSVGPDFCSSGTCMPTPTCTSPYQSCATSTL